MSGYGDENPDDEGREAVRDNAKSVSSRANHRWFWESESGSATGSRPGQETGLTSVCSLRSLRNKGLCQSVYSDRHSIFWTDREATIEEQLKNQRPTTEVGTGNQSVVSSLVLTQCEVVTDTIAHVDSPVTRTKKGESFLTPLFVLAWCQARTDTGSLSSSPSTRRHLPGGRFYERRGFAAQWW
jgi:hypothetical protein